VLGQGAELAFGWSCGSVMPSFLPTAEWIQKRQPAIMATWSCAGSFKRTGIGKRR